MSWTVRCAGYQDAEQGGHTVYTLLTEIDGRQHVVERRFSSFLELHDALLPSLAAHLPARFPVAKTAFGKNRTSVKQARKVQLEAYLRSVIAAAGAAPQALAAADVLRRFLAGPPAPALLHVKARSQDNGEYPQRQPVADDEVPWDVALPGYAPAEWTHASVLANSRELSTGHKWAAPPQLERTELDRRRSRGPGERVQGGGQGEGAERHRVHQADPGEADACEERRERRNASEDRLPGG